jgi:hypothetical protein
MPLTRLIFFAEPRELTDEQYAEALALGHVRQDEAPADTPAFAAGGPITGGGTGTVTSGGDAGDAGDEDKTDEQGA